MGRFDFLPQDDSSLIFLCDSVIDPGENKGREFLIEERIERMRELVNTLYEKGNWTTTPGIAVRVRRELLALRDFIKSGKERKSRLERLGRLEKLRSRLCNLVTARTQETDYSGWQQGADRMFQIVHAELIGRLDSERESSKVSRQDLEESSRFIAYALSAAHEKYYGVGYGDVLMWSYRRVMYQTFASLAGRLSRSLPNTKVVVDSRKSIFQCSELRANASQAQ
jgi:hypothetical protein